MVLVAYGFYISQAVKGQSTPNPASWLIWFIAGIINAFTYFAVVEGNIWQSLFVITVTFAVLVILIYSAAKGRFSRLSRLDVIIFVLAIAVGIFWRTSENDRIANLLLQGIYIISYIPTFSGLVKGTAKEHYASWTAAVVAYSFATLALVVDTPGDWIAYVSPVVNGVIGNGLVVLLVLFQQKSLSVKASAL